MNFSTISRLFILILAFMQSSCTYYLWHSTSSGGKYMVDEVVAKDYLLGFAEVRPKGYEFNLFMILGKKYWYILDYAIYSYKNNEADELLALLKSNISSPVELDKIELNLVSDLDSEGGYNSFTTEVRLTYNQVPAAEQLVLTKNFGFHCDNAIPTCTRTFSFEGVVYQANPLPNTVMVQNKFDKRYPISLRYKGDRFRTRNSVGEVASKIVLTPLTLATDVFIILPTMVIYGVSDKFAD